jgi:hypothetical protein
MRVNRNAKIMTDRTAPKLQLQPILSFIVGRGGMGIIKGDDRERALCRANCVNTTLR